MRLSTLSMNNASVKTMLRQQSIVGDLQLKVSTGKKSLSPADNPYDASRSLKLDEGIAINEQYTTNIIHAQNRLGIEEGVLQNVSNVLQRVNELVVQANNDNLTNANRRAMSAEAEQLRDQLLALSNTTDSNGEFLFAGNKSKTVPFNADGAGNFTYAGDDGQRQLKIGASAMIAVGDSGTDVFRSIREGNGTYAVSQNLANTGTGVIYSGSESGFVTDNYTINFVAPAAPGDPPDYQVVLDRTGAIISTGTYQDNATISFNGANPLITGTPAAGDSFTVQPSRNENIFKIAQNLIDALEMPINNDASRANFRNEVSRVGGLTSSALDKVLEIRAKVGARQNTIDKQSNVNETFLLQMKTTKTTIEDIDLAKAITDLNLQLIGLQASQQSYSRIQGLSLFNYLS